MKGKFLAVISFLASITLLAGCSLFGSNAPTPSSSETESNVESEVESNVESTGASESSEMEEHVHSYDNACDTDCNGCGEERTASHVYDNACDADCNICGEARVPGEHDYDNACDVDCNDCGEEREVGDHDYDNACDTDCNECGEEREVGDHVYDNACDADCNECGDEREVGDHVYDDNTDDTCNECDYVRELPLTGDEDVSTVLWNSATNVETLGKGADDWASGLVTSVVDNTAIPEGYKGDATSFFKLENAAGAYLYFKAEKPVWYYEALKGKGLKVAFDVYMDTDVDFVNIGGKVWKPRTWLTRGDGSNILVEGEMADGNVVLLDTLLENPETILIEVWGAENSTYLDFYIGNFRIIEEKAPEVLPPLTGDEDIATVVWNSATKPETVGRASGSWGGTQVEVVDNTAIPAGYTGDATSFFKLTGSIGDRVYFTSDYGVDYYAALQGKNLMVAFDIYIETDVSAANIAGKNWKLNTWLTRGDGSELLVEGYMPDENVVLLDTLLATPETYMFDIWGADGNTYFNIYVGNFRLVQGEEKPEAIPPLTGDEDISTVVWNSVTNTETIGRATGSWGSTQVEIVDNTAIPAGYTGEATSFFKLTGAVGDLLYVTSDYGVDYYAALKGKGYLVTFDFYMQTEGEFVNSMGKQVKPNVWMTRGDGSNILKEGEMNDGNVVTLDALLDDYQTLMFDIWGIPGNYPLVAYFGNFRIVDPNAGSTEDSSESVWVWNSVNAEKTGVRYVCNGSDRDWGGTIDYVTEVGGKTGAFYKVTTVESGTYVQMNGIAVAAVNEKSYYEDILAADPDATLTFSFYYEDGAGAGVLSVNGKYNIGLANYEAKQWHTLSISLATLVDNYDNLISGKGDKADETGALVAIGGASDTVTFYVGDFAIDTTATK